MNTNEFTDPARRDLERHLLSAVDASENSRRAVMYLADFFGAYRDVFITLLSIIPEPSEDFFGTDQERRRWLAAEEEKMGKILNEYKEILLGAGFEEGRIDSRLSIRRCVSVADEILKEQEKLRCCIVAVGRRGLSHNEEFLLGSTSNRILHHARNCAVMVIE
ncbi:MAG: universal stress protein [Desulfurivibrionaceae bacterium]